jgi:hypothetical protein
MLVAEMSILTETNVTLVSCLSRCMPSSTPTASESEVVNFVSGPR